MKIERLGSDNFDALKRFSQAVWPQRPRTEAYYRWRYVNAPSHTTLLALQKERCVATVSAFMRRYRNGDAVIDCLEAFDWYTLPEMRGSGVGIRLMKSLLDGGKPMVALGGSADTLQLLPRLGFKTVSAATEFFLPLSGAYLLRKRPLPAALKKGVAPLLSLAAASWFKPAKPAAGNAFEFLPISRIDASVARIDGPGGFRRLPEPRAFSWLDKGIGTGKYVGMITMRRGATVAWSIARLHHHDGLLHGAILDLRLAYGDPQLASASLAAMARALIECGVDDVRFTTTSEFLGAACKSAGFLAARERIPAMIAPAGQTREFDSICMSYGPDGAFWPLEEESTGAGARFAEWGQHFIHHHGPASP